MSAALQWKIENTTDAATEIIALSIDPFTSAVFTKTSDASGATPTYFAAGPPLPAASDAT